MPWELQEAKGIKFYRSQLLATFSWLEQGFSTRGLSPERVGEGAESTADLCSGVGELESEQEYRRRFFALFGLTPQRTQLVKQVHGDRVLIVDEPQFGEEVPEADAMVTNQPGVGLVTIHADCVPVVLVDPVHRVIAAVHAGWKGTLAGIVPKTLMRMGEAYGSRPEDCWAAIGPAIGSCCYAVAPERINLFREKWPQLDLATSKGESVLDLAAINQQCLENLGLATDHIDNARLCTACHSEDFYSFRREQTTSRMLSLIVMK